MSQQLIEKIQAIQVQPAKKVALAYSGGLDSTLCIKLLQNFYHAEQVLLINVNVGQGAVEIEKARTQASSIGLDVIHLDAEEEFLSDWVSKAIKANSSYGGYPLATAMTRHLIAKKVAEIALEHKCDAVSEGTTGKSNDQFRMRNTFELFGSGIRTIQPIREFDLSRVDEKQLAEYFQIAYYEAMFGGDDKTIWCRSIASGAITSLDQIPPDVWIWYVPIEQAKDEATYLDIEFLNGIPIAVDHKEMSLKQILNYLNPLVGQNGIGFIDTWEQDVIDVKSREFYEAPGAVVILEAHKNLERVCFPKDELRFKETVDSEWARLVFNGDWFHPLKDNLDAFIDKSQEAITGTVKLMIYKGNIRVIECSSKYSLYKPEIRALQSRGFDQRICGPAAELKALPYRILAMRK